METATEAATEAALKSGSVDIKCRAGSYIYYYVCAG
jgi:hypothetical protein